MQAYDDLQKQTVGDMIKSKDDKMEEQIKDLMNQENATSVHVFQHLPKLKANLRDVYRKINIKEFDSELKSLIKQSLDIVEELKD